MVTLEAHEDLPRIEPIDDEIPVRIPLDDRPHEGNWLSKLRAEAARIVGPCATEAVVDNVKLIVDELGSNGDREGRTAQALVLGRIVASNRLLVGITDDGPTWGNDGRDSSPTLAPSKSQTPSEDLIRKPKVRDNILETQGTQGRGLGLVQELVGGPIHYAPELNDEEEIDGKTVWVEVDPTAEAETAAIPFDINNIEAI